LWHFHCTPGWFILPLFSFFPLSLLKMTSQVSMFHIYTCVENRLTTFTILYPLHSPSPSPSYPPLTMTCFKFLSFTVSVSVRCAVCFCLGILPVSILYRNRSNPLYYSSLAFSPTPYCQQLSVSFAVLLLHRWDVFQ
jgi:hypothetical protein